MISDKNTLITSLKNLGYEATCISPTSTVIEATYKNLHVTITPNRIFSRFYLENSTHLPAKFPGFVDIFPQAGKIEQQLAELRDNYDRICRIYEETVALDKQIEANRERMLVLGLVDRAEPNGLVNHAENLTQGEATTRTTLPIKYEKLANLGVKDMNKTEQVLSAFKSKEIRDSKDHPQENAMNEMSFRKTVAHHFPDHEIISHAVTSKADGPGHKSTTNHFTLKDKNNKKPHKTFVKVNVSKKGMKTELEHKDNSGMHYTLHSHLNDPSSAMKHLATNHKKLQGHINSR